MLVAQWTEDKTVTMQKGRTKCEQPTRRRVRYSGAFGEMRRWYRRWVAVREARYRYLAAILDGTPEPSHELAPVRPKREIDSRGEQR